MRRTITTFILVALTAVTGAFIACGATGGGGDSEVETSSAVTVTPAASVVALGGSTTVTVSGGSGSYVGASATEGTMTYVSNGVYIYAAPASVTSAAVTLGVSDSAGNVGYAYLTVGASGTLSVSAAATSLALGASTTVTVTGGTGSYPTYSASQGTLTLSSTNTFVYAAPSSASSSSVTITVYDSAGQVGYAYLTIGTTSSSAYTCGGTYDAQIGGIPAVISLVGDSNHYVAGYVAITGYYYPVFGTCTFDGSTGTLSMKNLSLNQTYAGSVTLSSSRAFFAGSVTTSTGAVYGWSAAARAVPAATTWPAYSCEGNYNAVIAGNSGMMVLVENGAGQVAGYLYLQGYFYALSGTCNGAGGTISLSNLTSGSPYTGTVGFSGSTVYLNGSFTTTGGSVYAWSATSY